MPKRQTYSNPPKIIPPLILVDTGERCIIDGKRCRILKIERANTSDISYKITSKDVKKRK